ncbi:MAG: DUF58 domain-containing protein [Planctomycetota bacterium]
MTLTNHIAPDDLKSISNLQLLARTVVEGLNTGLHKSPDKGASIDFKQHRPYVPGDDLRNLDWKVFAKSDKFFIREYEQETNLQAMLLLDASGSMKYRSPLRKDAISKHEYAVRLSACLAYLMIRQGDSAGLLAFDTEVRAYIPPRGRAGHVGVLLDEMAKSQTAGETDLGKVLRDASSKIKRRGLIVLVSDCFGDVTHLLRGLAHYRHANHDILILQVWDRDELDFPFKRWHRFDSLERPGEHQMLDPAQMRRAYLQKLGAFRDQLRSGCRKQRIDLVEVTTDEPYGVALAAYLARRQAISGRSRNASGGRGGRR